MKPILFRWCRSEKDNSYGVDGNKIGDALVEREARGILCRNFDRRVDGQMWMFLAEMCRAIENLHGDMSYVLIRGHKWQIRWWQWFWRWRRSFWRWRFKPEDFWQRWSRWERALKGFIDHRSWGSGKYRQNKTARHKKIRAVALIPC